MASDELYKRKIVALLHDTPTKPWVINGRLRLFKSAGGLEGERAHEAEAKGWLRELGLGDDDIERFFEEVRAADRVASSFDRWQLLEWRSGKLVKPKQLYNPFDPSKSHPVGVPKEDDVRAYLKELKKLLSSVKSWQLKYHLLYASLEALWYLKVEDVPPPADTRIPHHTVFDHVYATATISNVYDGKWRGTLLFIDFPGIQAFIKEARGPRDAWAGSWLVSALAWKAVEDFVWNYGPDVLVTPTARYNPFYYTFLRGKIGNVELGSLGTIFNALEATQPVMPATLTLLLPDSASNWENVVMKNTMNAWKEIVEAVECEAKGLIEKFPAWDSKKDSEYFEKIKDWPPLTPFVVSVDLRGAHNEFQRSEQRQKLLEKCKEKVKDERLCEELAEKAFYHWLMTVKLREEIKNAKEQRIVGPKVLLPAIERSEEAYEKGKAIPLCRCGLPAVVHAKPGGGSPKQKELRVREGETLCPYCLVKRLLSYHFDKVSKKLFGVKLSHKGIGSTSTLASLPSLLNYLESKLSPESAEKMEELKEVLMKISFYEDVVAPLRRGEEPEEPLDKVFVKQDLKKYEGFGKYVAMIVADGDEMGRLVSGDLGAGYLAKVRERIEELLKEPMASKEGAESPAKLKPEDLEEIIREAFGPKASGEKCDEPVTPSTLVTPTYHAQLSYSLMIGSLIDKEIVESFGGVVVYAGGDDLVALVPSKGSKMRENGKLTAYGKKIDELKSKYGIKWLEDHFSLHPALAVWWTTRKLYWGELAAPLGFNELRVKVNGETKTVAVVPALRKYGRKYGIAIRHYREPLALTRERAGMLEENAKEIIRGELCKDGVAVEYGRGAGEAPVTPLPNTALPKGGELTLGAKLLKALSLVDDGALSSSAFRDVLEAVAPLKKYTDEKVKKISFELALYYALRNAQRNKADDVRRALEELSGLTEESFELKRRGSEPTKLNPVAVFFEHVLTWQRASR